MKLGLLAIVEGLRSEGGLTRFISTFEKARYFFGGGCPIQEINKRVVWDTMLLFRVWKYPTNFSMTSFLCPPPRGVGSKIFNAKLQVQGPNLELTLLSHSNNNNNKNKRMALSVWHQTKRAITKLRSYLHKLRPSFNWSLTLKTKSCFQTFCFLRDKSEISFNA